MAESLRRIILEACVLVALGVLLGLMLHHRMVLDAFSGNLVPPVDNIPPGHIGSDPHNHPRSDVPGGVQKDVFYETGHIADPRGGAPWITRQCPAQSSVPVSCG